VRKVLAVVTAAALGPLERRAGDGLGDVEQVLDVDHGVPAGIVVAIAGDAGARGARTQAADRLERERHLAPGPYDADVVLHQLLQRSEERRVGKERRSRWSPYHYKTTVQRRKTTKKDTSICHSSTITQSCTTQH